MKCEYCKYLNNCLEARAIRCIEKEKERQQRVESKRQAQLYRAAQKQYDRP